MAIVSVEKAKAKIGNAQRAVLHREITEKSMWDHRYFTTVDGNSTDAVLLNRGVAGGVPLDGVRGKKEASGDLVRGRQR